MSWSDGDSGDVVEFDVGCAGVLGVVGGCVGLSVGTTAVKVQYNIIIMRILLLCIHNHVCILLLCIIHVQYL